MIKMLILYTALAFADLDLQHDSLTFMKCGDQVLVEKEQVTVLSSQKTVVSDVSKIQGWFNEMSQIDEAECLQVNRVIKGGDSMTLDFNKVVIRDQQGFDRVYIYDDFGKIVYFNEARENGRTVEYIYDEAGNPLKTIDSENGVTDVTISGSQATVNTYNFDGSLQSSDVVSTKPINLECQNKCLDIFAKEKPTIGMDKAREHARACVARCPK